MVDGKYILFEFTALRLLAQLLLSAALFIHLFVNVRPLLMALGVLRRRECAAGLYLIVSLVLLFCTSAVINYYLGGVL
jgi:succinate dehydrogenase/fumarate reductase cytochrome b subunit